MSRADPVDSVDLSEGSAVALCIIVRYNVHILQRLLEG